MAREDLGICPNCETREGPVGSPCPTDVCSRKGYHFIPKPWYESAREFAARKHKAMDPLLGRCIDRYLLVGKLGEGGMGAVYLAYQRPLNREVALKVISGMELSDAAIARFEREARAIALLDHANIRKLYDYGIGQLEFRIPYMALEYVRHGRTLRRALAQIEEQNGGRIPVEVIRIIFRQVLNALGAAHEQGIVHRDMKPDNIMIAPEHGNPYMVKILDFGLAKAVSDLSGFDKDVTSSGTLLGTPAYMAPEQAPKQGLGAVDGRADLYAVAVMLFEIFAGVRPFPGDSPLAILVKKTDPQYDPLDLPEAQGLPAPLRAFLRKGLAADPNQRFQTASEMLEAFESAIASEEIDLAKTTKIQIPISSKDYILTPASPPGSSSKHQPAGGTPKLVQQKSLEPTLRVEGPSRRRFWPLIGGVIFVLAAALAVAYVFGGSSEREGGGEEGKALIALDYPKDAYGASSTDLSDTYMARGIDPKGRALASSTALEKASPALPTEALILPHRFIVRTTPPGAKVLVEGREVGESPASYEFWSSEEGLSREVEVVARAKGFREAKLKVKLSDAVRDGEVSLSLERVGAPEVRPQVKPRPKPEPRFDAPRRL